jgi:acetyl-CoA carboxylase/biotin carboxylase 1
LELKDPSKVKRIETFEGTLDIPAAAVEMDAEHQFFNILAGSSSDPDAAVQPALAKKKGFESVASFVTA